MNEAFTGLFTGIEFGFGNMWSQLHEYGKVSLSEFPSLFANCLQPHAHDDHAAHYGKGAASTMTGGQLLAVRKEQSFYASRESTHKGSQIHHAAYW